MRYCGLRRVIYRQSQASSVSLDVVTISGLDLHPRAIHFERYQPKSGCYTLPRKTGPWLEFWTKWGSAVTKSEQHINATANNTRLRQKLSASQWTLSGQCESREKVVWDAALKSSRVGRSRCRCKLINWDSATHPRFQRAGKSVCRFAIADAYCGFRRLTGDSAGSSASQTSASGKRPRHFPFTVTFFELSGRSARDVRCPCFNFNNTCNARIQTVRFDLFLTNRD